MTTYCCESMRAQVEHRCAQHQDARDCPDVVVLYSPRLQEFSLPIRDGGSSSICIRYCPWCGSALPASQRDRWFDEIEALGLDPWTDDVPEEYQTDAWRRSKAADDPSMSRGTQRAAPDDNGPARRVIDPGP